MTETATTGVRLAGIRKTYGHFTALDGVDLSVGEGEFVTLLGASGSGKTTLLNVTAGMISPDDGRVFIGDKDVTAVPSRHRGLGMVFQSYALVPHMTVYDNIAFPLRIRRLPADEIRRRVNRILEVVELSDFGARKPRQLSGGQQQRVAIARCLVYEPPVVLMDEPLGALDKKLREQLQSEIRRIHRDLGMTILYVTHDQEEALFLSDRICLMNKGSIEQIGTPHDLYFQPRNSFVADFIGESNLIPCETDSVGTARLVDENVVIRVTGALPADDGKRCQLLIRPESLAILKPQETRINELEGIVEETAFIGNATRYLVRLAGGRRLIVRYTMSEGEIVPALGASVRVGWEPDQGRLLPG